MNPDSSNLENFYFVYILRNEKNKQWYTGYTKDLQRRLEEHREGKSEYTKNRGLYELIYYEAYKNEQDARSRELQLKSGRGKKYLRMRIKNFLELSG